MRFVRPLEELRIRKEPLGCCNGTGLLGVDQRLQDDMNAYNFKFGELVMHFPGWPAQIKAAKIPGTSEFRCVLEPASAKDGGFIDCFFCLLPRMREFAAARLALITWFP